MARISTYTVDTSVEASDKLLGSNADGTTKNFTIEDIATFFKNTNAAGISGQIPYVYYNAGFGGNSGRPTGSITLANTDATTGFSTLSTLKISKFPFGASSKEATNFITEFANKQIIIVDFTNMNNYGVYDVSTVVQDSSETNFYDLALSFITGNGSLVSGQYYSLGFYTGAQDETFVFTQGDAATQWVITHNLNKRCSVTVVDSSNSVIIGEVVYNSSNQVTVNFSSAFSGKAFIN